MDHHRFATLARVLTSVPPRRHVLTGLAGLGLALGTSWLPDHTEAKKKRNKKRKRKKGKKSKQPKPNKYGCLSVNVACKSAEACCTGICEGGKCRAHGTAACPQEKPGLCLADSPMEAICSSANSCACLETTGGSKYCGSLNVRACADCRKDADCIDLGFPAGSACVPFETRICAGTCASDMMCVAPCGVTP